MKHWRYIFYFFALFSVPGQETTDQVQFTENRFYTDGLRVVAVYFNDENSQSEPLCFVHSNRSRLRVVTSKPTFVSSDSMDAMIDQCQRTKSNRSAEDYIEHVRRKRGAIPMYPGTKWCGDGNISANYSDLGENRDTDICCRDHDHCQEYILPFSRRYGLFNWSAFTRCSCDCDNQLYDCLKNSTDSAADRIGYIFFNVLGTECFRYEYTKICLKKILFLCVKHGLNTAEPKVMRFFHGRKY